jgi:hypothetical protein
MILGPNALVIQARRQPHHHLAYHPRSRVITPPPLAPVVVVLPFGYTTEQLPVGVSIMEEDVPHDFVGTGTELLLLLVVVAAAGWHVIRCVAVPSDAVAEP